MGNTPLAQKCPRCIRGAMSAGFPRVTTGGLLVETGETGRVVRRKTLYRTGEVLQRQMQCLRCGYRWMTTHPDRCPDHPLHGGGLTPDPSVPIFNADSKPGGYQMLNEIKTAHNADGSLLTIEAAEGFNGLSATQYVDDSHGREYTHFAADLAANMAGADFKRAEVYAAYTDGSMDEFITVRVTQRQIVKGDDVDTITAGSVAARITPDDAIRLRRELNKAIGAARRNGYVFGEGG